MTWVKIGEGQALISAGDTYKAKNSYGANSKAISIAQLPRHRFNFKTNSAGGIGITQRTEYMNLGGMLLVKEKQMQVTRCGLRMAMIAPIIIIGLKQKHHGTETISMTGLPNI